jgi:hypothetical protein
MCGSGRDEEPSGENVLRLIQNPLNDAEFGKNLASLSRPAYRNRESRFGFQKRSQLFIHSHNETLSVVAMEGSAVRSVGCARDPDAAFRDC